MYSQLLQQTMSLQKTLGRVLNRPTIFPIPEFVLKLIFSEGAKVLTDGQSVIPKRLLDLGFNFKYKNIDETLKNLAKWNKFYGLEEI